MTLETQAMGAPYSTTSICIGENGAGNMAETPVVNAPRATLTRIGTILLTIIFLRISAVDKP